MKFSFFIDNNSSGYKTRENWFSKNHPTEYENIINYSTNIKLSLSFKEKIWFYFNNLTERPKCKTCGNEIKFRERFDKPYGEFCSLKCINENKEEMNNRIKVSMNRKFGVDFFPQHNTFISKQKLTKLSRYGNENYNNFSMGIETKKKKYGIKNISNQVKQKITCMSKYGVDNYSKSCSYRNKINDKFKLLYPNVNFININKFNVELLCNYCNNSSVITKQLLYERNKRNQNVCLYCNPFGQTNKSHLEKEISEFLTKNEINNETSNRILLNGKEIDILINDYNIAIEVNGIYWYNELFVNSDYHLNKTILCQENNIDLIHIFEDEWLYKNEIVKSILLNRFNKTPNKIYARKCTVKEIDNKTTKEFLNNNHIQGYVNSSIRLGLFHKNQLVSVMSFSKGRILMGGKKDEWELNRFSNIINYTIIGGADKLFKYFIKNYNPQKIISYSDIRLFNGNLYNKLGFVWKSQSKPNYWYVINGIRYHRFNFRKSVLIKDGFDKDKTEREIMFDRKIYRIYDCGNIRWEYNL